MLGELLWLFLGGGYIGGKCISEKARALRGQRDPFWWSSKNYNIELQNKYEHMVFFEKEKVEKMLGHPIVISSIKNKREVVTELLKRDGYDYHDLREALDESARVQGRKRRF